MIKLKAQEKNRKPGSGRFGSGKYSPTAIKRMRVASGLTQEDFARLLGVAISTIVRWESGFSQPSEKNEKFLNLVHDCIGGKPQPYVCEEDRSKPEDLQTVFWLVPRGRVLDDLSR